MSNLNDRIDCNFIEVYQEKTESRTAYFQVPKDITVDDVEIYLKERNRSSVDGDDNFFPEWDNPEEEEYCISQSDQRCAHRPYSFINYITINDDKTKLIISNLFPHTTGVLFRDLTKVK